jgi:diacylglycerol diphosphate phosphatase / phosphatidate phosphatase
MDPPLTERPGVIGALARTYQRTYAADYIGFVLLQGAYYLARFFVLPAHQQFTLDDRRIQHPYAQVERVSGWQNTIYAGFIPLGILVVWSLVARSGLHKTHVTVLGLLISTSLTSFLTHVVKNAIGRPRPDLISRCKPAPGTAAHDLVGIGVCTQTDSGALHDGWRSFPSGHSSFAFSGLGYLTLFMAGQLHTIRPRADLARVLVTFAPLVGAMLIAMSRMADYRHDVYDVSVGSLLGALIAYFAYRRYWRPLRDTRCHEPLPSPLTDLEARRAVGRKPSPPKDEEEQIQTAGEFDLEDFTEDEAERGLLDNSGNSSPTELGKQRGEDVDPGGGSGSGRQGR